jgi:hypothetical protein
MALADAGAAIEPGQGVAAAQAYYRQALAARDGGALPLAATVA